MGLTGPEKDRYNFVQQRIKEQKEFWPQFVKELDEKSGGKRFRSEILSYEELWDLYLHGIDESLTPEEEARGKKKSKVDKVSEVVPIKAFELPGRFSEIGKHHKGTLGYLHFDQWLYARDQARKDLYWLCKDVFQLDLQPHVHQVVCDQFLTKNFDGVYSDGYSLKDFQNALDNQNRVPHHWVKTAEYEKRTLADFGHYVKDPIEQEKSTNFAKTMVLLDPRGFFKSTIDAIDAVQLIINCPDIRILIVSGVKKLGDQFLKMVKVGPKMRTFYLPKGVRPEPFHLLFPEFVVRGVNGTSDEPMIIGESSKAPQRYFSGDPTIGVISVGSSLSGFHCDYLKFDDIVTDDNCLTETTREAILLKADGAVNMLMGWGWHDIIGTRYFPDDYYGLTKKTHDDNPEMFNLKFFQRACWTVKPEFKEVEKKSLFELTEEMVTLTFPELVQTPHKSWLDLRKRMKNERSFRCFPVGSLVLMSDWTEKNIENIKPGDEVIGFSKGLEKTVVTHVHSKRDVIVKATTETGRVVYATKDHEFLKPINRKRREYGHLKVGRAIVSVYKPNPNTISTTQQRIMDWLSGILDGEGSCGSQVVLYQSEKENPEMCYAIRERLRILGIPFEESLDSRNQVVQFKLGGGRSLKIRFLQNSALVRKQRIIDSLWESSKMIAESSGRRGGSSYEKIVSIEEIGDAIVYDLTTTTSNYVCQGFAVHNCQQLNQPVWGEESTIDLNRALLEAHRNKTFSEVMATGIDGKQQGYIYGAIDLARENKQFSDFTALAVGKVYQEGAKQSLSPDELSNSFASVDGKWILVILDVQFGKWSQTEIASRIAAMHNKWKPIQWYGEDTGGLVLLKEKIVDTCKTTYGHWPYIVWKTPENSDQAKRNRIRGIETLLRNDRMFFLYASWNDEVFEQIEKYKGQKSTRYFKDDVPDVISRLTQFVPSLISLSKKEIQEQTDQKEALYRHFVRQEMRKAIFGDDNGGFGMQQEYAYYNPPPESRGPVDDIRMKYLGR